MSFMYVSQRWKTLVLLSTSDKEEEGKEEGRRGRKGEVERVRLVMEAGGGAWVGYRRLVEREELASVPTIPSLFFLTLTMGLETI